MDYSKLASEDVLAKTQESLASKGYLVSVVGTKEDALEKIKEIIPSGARVMNGSSVTLQEIGYMDYLKSGTHSWTDLHAEITAENDEAKRHELRNNSLFSEYYVGSVHALVENGDFIVASNSSSQLPHIVSTSPNLVFVVSTKKIVPSLEEAMNRLDQYVVPLEDKRMMNAYSMHTQVSKVLIFKAEPGFTNRKIHFILVNEELGY